MPEEKPQKPRIYWDSNVFLSYINGLSDRLPEIETLLLEAEKDTIELLTSTLSIVEVAYATAEKDQHALDDQTEERINKLWIPSSPVKLVEFHRLIAEDARNLMRRAVMKQWSLKPYDAVHLSTALRMAADEFHTYDEKLFKYDELVSYKVQRPFVAQTGLFPPA
jgi:predicted nucleic acid-binding protein